MKGKGRLLAGAGCLNDEQEEEDDSSNINQ